MSVEPTGGCLLGAVPGAGKTAMSIALARGIGATRMLVIAPLGTRENWERHMSLLGLDIPFYHLKTVKGETDNLDKLLGKEPGLYFIGTQLFVAIGNKLNDTTGRKVTSKLWEKVSLDLTVGDEIHKGGSNRKSLTYKTLSRLKDPGYRLALSGTPAGNKFDGIWSVTRWVWPDIINASYYIFKERYCETVFDPFTYDHKKIIGEKNPGEYLRSLPCYIRLEPDEKFEIDDQRIDVELYPDQRIAYDQLAKEMITWVESHAITPVNAVSLRARLKQASLAMFYLNEKGEVDFLENGDSSVYDSALDILVNEYKSEPTLMFTESQRFARYAVNRLNTRNGMNAIEYSGKVSRKNRDVLIQKFIDAEVSVVVCVIAAGGTGLDGFQLATGNVIYLNEADGNHVDMDQSLARVARKGQDRKIRVRRIIPKQTVAGEILEKRILAKLDMDAILKA